MLRLRNLKCFQCPISPIEEEGTQSVDDEEEIDTSAFVKKNQTRTMKIKLDTELHENRV